MQRMTTTVGLMILLCCAGSLRAEDKSAAAETVDKAIAAAGGQEQLAAAKAVTWHGKGTLTIQGNDNQFSTHYTAQGLDHFRAEFEGQFNNGDIKGVTVIDGDKGWRKFNDNVEELDKDAVANEKRNIYLQLLPMLLVPLTDKQFKLEAAPEQKVNDKPAAVVKVAPPDGKEFTLFFDKETGLPVKMVAKVTGWDGNEFTQETTYADYKDFDGIKKATHIESKRDGEKFIDYKVTDFKPLDKVDAAQFAKPEA